MPNSYSITKTDYDLLKSYADNGSYIEYYNKLEQLGDRYARLARANHSVTILYSGFTGGVYNGNIATDLANRMGEEARVLDNT